MSDKINHYLGNVSRRALLKTGDRPPLSGPIGMLV